MVLIGLLIQDKNESVPLKEISVRSSLQGVVVGFRSKFIYENESSEPLEVFFRTPVDDSYAVVDLEAVIDGRKIRAKIHEKEKAKELYQEAIASGLTAAFGEEKKGDIFSVVLGNLPPGKKAEIHLTMVGELGVEPDGSVRFTLPTILKPRYTPAGGSDPLQPIPDSNMKRAEGPLSHKFNLVISGTEGIAEVMSPSHRITTQPSGQVINVGLDLDEGTPKDVVILIRPKEPHKPLVIVEPGLYDGANDFQKSSVVMVSFFPEFKGDTSCMQAACECVFVVDRSGSMEGEYIRAAAQTLLLFLKSIPEGCYFNIIGFGNSFEKLFPESVPYNQENLEKAVKHAEGLQADLGGTEIFSPLQNIFGVAQMKGLPRQVFVLTDGSVSNTESVIKLVSKNSHNARCFSFGIGSGASTTLVKGIAQAGNGTAEFITSGERMQPKVIRSLKKAMQPAVTSTEVMFDLPKSFGVQAAPQNIPPMFIGERTIVYGILTGPPNEKGSIILSGDLLGEKIKHKVNFETPVSVPKDDDTVTTIHYLAAKRMIKEMEIENSVRRNDEVIKLSCDSNVISSLTGFIAIDDDQKEPVKGSVQIWDILDRPCDSITMAMCARKLKSRSKKIPIRFSSTRMKKEVSKFDVECDEVQYLTSNVKCLTKSVQPFFPKENLSTIISLQMASGAWYLTAELAGVIGMTVNDIKQDCPVSCDGKMEAIWATIIALCYLERKQFNLKEEWELIAAKAKAWLQKQNLPRGCVIESLRKKAITLIN